MRLFFAQIAFSIHLSSHPPFRRSCAILARVRVIPAGGGARRGSSGEVKVRHRKEIIPLPEV